MKTSLMEKDYRVRYPVQIPITSCVFCGKKFGYSNFKGKYVCDRCLIYIRGLITEN